VIGGGKLLNILDIEKETIERALESKLLTTKKQYFAFLNHIALKK